MQKRLGTFSKIVPIIVGVLLSSCGPAAVPIAAGLITGAAGAGSKILEEKRERDSREQKAQPLRNIQENFENVSEAATECYEEAGKIYLGFDASKWFGELYYEDAVSIPVSQMMDDTKVQSDREVTLLVNWSDEFDRCSQPVFSFFESVEHPKLEKKMATAASYLKKMLLYKNEAVVGYVKGEYTRGDVAQKIAQSRTEEIE